MSELLYKTRWMRVLVAMAFCLPTWAADGIPTSVDWSHQHLIITNAASLQERMAAGRDPRALSNWIRRSRAQAAQQWQSRLPRGQNGFHRQKGNMARDWSVSLGAGRVAPGMSPAKFGISIANSPSCVTDYMAFGLDVAATANTPGGQANLVGLRNLYSGGSAGNPGFCGLVNVAAELRIGNTVTVATSTAHSFTAGMQVSLVGLSDSGANGTWTVTAAPSTTQFSYTTTGLTGTGGSTVGTASYGAASIAFAYNITTAGGGRILTSPTISLDGAKIAFVESTASASIFHVLTLDPCVTSAAGCTSNGTSAAASAVPGNGNAASMVSITYSNSSNTRSSPWIDYSTDSAYVGDDNGTLYRIANVFYGTPALDTTFGGSGKLVVNSGTQLTGPVLAQGWILVGDSQGLLWALQATSPYTILGAQQVGGGQSGSFIYGIVDPPVVDASTTGILSAFVASGQSTAGNFVLAQAVLNISTQSFTIARTLNVGRGAGSSHINGHAPALDNNYYLGTIDATHGFIYTCGTQAASTHPKLYRYGFTAGSPPILSATINGQVSINNSSVECSPMTEFANPNLATTDLLFVGDSGNEVQSFDISGAMPAAASATVTEPSGTSGIIVDTTQLSNNQGSSIYFSTQSNVGGNCGAGNYCAIKLTQAGLQ